MIITSSTFILNAAAQAVPLTHPRILWRNRIANLLPAAITVSGETAEGPRDAVTRPNTDEYWEMPSLPAWMLIDLGSAYDIEGVGLAGHNFGSTHTAIKVQVGTDPGFATDATFGEERMPDDDSSILVLDDKRTARFIRFDFTGSGAVLPRLAVASAGDVLAMEKAVSGPYRPISRARRTIGSARKSRGGQYLGQNMRSHGLEGEIAFRNLSSDWVLANFEPFSKHARSLPYFLAWNPAELERDVGYCWQDEGDEDIVPEYNGTGLDMDVSWRMVGLGHE